MESASDQEIFKQIRDGNQAAFRKLFDRYYRVLLGTAVNLVKSEDIGKDLVQEVLVTVWKKREEIEIQSSAANYLKRSVINRCLNHLQRSRKHADVDEMVEQPSTPAEGAANLAHADLQSALNAALDKLPERCRTIFVMKRLEGLSQKEIAQQLDISTKTVENQITKALKVLSVALRHFREKNPGET